MLKKDVYTTDIDKNYLCYPDKYVHFGKEILSLKSEANFRHRN